MEDMKDASAVAEGGVIDRSPPRVGERVVGRDVVIDELVLFAENPSPLPTRNSMLCYYSQHPLLPATHPSHPPLCRPK